MPVVVTVFSVTLILQQHAAVVHRVHTEETGTFLMGHDFHSVPLHLNKLLVRVEVTKGLIFAIGNRVHLVYITATYQPVKFMMTLILVYEIQYMSDSI